MEDDEKVLETDCHGQTLPDLLVAKLTKCGFDPLPDSSIFKQLWTRQRQMHEEKKNEEEADQEEEEQVEEEDNDGRNLSKEETQSMIARFPYEYSGIQHAMCFPLTFSLPMSRLQDMGRNCENLRIELSSEDIKRAWGKHMNFKPGNYHLVPLEVRTRSVDSRGVPIRLCYNLLSRSLKDEKSVVSWTFADTPMNGTDWLVTNGIIAADQLERPSGELTWRADSEVVLKEEFQRMKMLNFDEFHLSNLGQLVEHNVVKVRVPTPCNQKARFSDLVEWVLTANRGLSIAGQAEDDDEEYNLENLAFPKEVYNKLIQGLEKKSGQSDHLMCLDEGLILELAPAEKCGWGHVQKLQSELEAYAQLGIPSPTVSNPTMHLTVTLELYAVPLVASARGQKCTVSGPINVGYAPRSTKMASC